jgi:excisionase family DNA binding protein
VGCVREGVRLTLGLVEDWYTTTEAARLLGVGDSRIRQMLLAGELEGERDPITERWKIPQHAVHARRAERRPVEPPRTPVDAFDWLEKVENLRQELGRLEGRLELTAQAESTLRESLERERERADRLEDELREERSRRGFWQRLFGP